MVAFHKRDRLLNCSRSIKMLSPSSGLYLPESGPLDGVAAFLKHAYPTPRVRTWPRADRFLPQPGEDMPLF